MKRESNVKLNRKEMETKKIQISLDHLRKIIYNAETAKKNDDSLSSTIVFELENETDTHLGSDEIRVTLKSSYSECNGREIF